MNNKKWVFPAVLAGYAVLFFTALAFGLNWFWGYMADFEASRPETVLDAYMQSLSEEYVTEKCEALIGQIDPNVQSREQCVQVIAESLDGDFTCAKKGKESTQERYVYAIRCGMQVVGTMTMERTGDMAGNFRKWQVTKEEFDLSYLLAEPISITVPENYPVYACGNLLPSQYITKDKIPYEPLKGLYEEYQLPYMVTYTAGPFLGEGTLTVTDPNGAPVTIDETTDMTAFAQNCTAEQVAAGDAHTTAFIQCYVDFLSRTGGDSLANYYKLSKYLIPDSDLQKRMYNAMEGLSWVTDRGAKIASQTVHNRVDMGGGRYLWDVSYVVDTKDFSGSIQTTARVKLILAETAAGLKTEALKSG